MTEVNINIALHRSPRPIPAVCLFPRSCFRLQKYWQL